MCFRAHLQVQCLEKQAQKAEKVWEVSERGRIFRFKLSVFAEEELFLGALGDDEVFRVGLRSPTSSGLHYLRERNLLFSDLSNGSVMIYRTNKLPHLEVICLVQAGKSLLDIQSIVLNEKEYVVTLVGDYTVRIWHLVKGRMRLLKVIRMGDAPRSLVYLENYKMIAIGCQSNYVKFFRFPWMRLERTVYLSECGAHFLFFEGEEFSWGDKREEKLNRIYPTTS